MKIKVNDKVRVMVGKDKGKEAVVTQVLPKKQMVVLEGVNQVVRHRKPQYGQSGERVTLTKPFHVSKVAVLNQSGEVDRIGYQRQKDGSKIRVYRKSGEQIVSETTTTAKTAKKTTKQQKTKKTKK